MKRELAETSEKTSCSTVSLLGLSRYPISLDGDEGELTSHEERIDKQEDRDDSQTGGGTNELAPSGSRLRRHTNGI